MTKRRDLVLASASMAGLMIPGLGRAAEPCPPPQVNLSGGTSATTNCTIVSGGSYSTSFNATENPITEGGRWVNGKAVGIDWQNIASENGRAKATDFMYTAPPYDDCIAHLSPAFLAAHPNQYAQGTVYRAPGYNQGHEIELYVRLLITPRNARGYEAYWNVAANDIYLVRWNGPLNSFTPLANVHIASPATTGDVMRMEINFTTITVKVNGATVITRSDPTWATGQPGLGLNPYGAGSDFTSWTFSDWSGGSL